MAGGGGGGAALAAAAAWEIAVVFVLRPLLAFAFVLSIIALSTAALSSSRFGFWLEGFP
jgi:hypothetical protein